MNVKMNRGLFLLIAIIPLLIIPLIIAFPNCFRIPSPILVLIVVAQGLLFSSLIVYAENFKYWEMTKCISSKKVFFTIIAILTAVEFGSYVYSSPKPVEQLLYNEILPFVLGLLYIYFLDPKIQKILKQNDTDQLKENSSEQK
ncbi:hypothetical protein [Lonepinella sp. BR2474]|uniref:hypothetical protein n=1 Tax=Lonepinella sp. BR2474 TaxID=3434548 RepID=UPI003F6DF6EA